MPTLTSTWGTCQHAKTESKERSCYRPLPLSISSVRTICWQHFADAVEILLDEDVELTRYDTVSLLILLAKWVEDPEDNREHYDLGQAEYRTAQLYHRDSADKFCTVEELGIMLDRIRAVVEAERAEAERAEEARRAVEAEMMGEGTIKDSEFSVYGADDRDDGEDASNAIQTGVVTMTLRSKATPNLSKFEGSLKRRNLKPSKSKSELLSMFQQGGHGKATKRDDL